MVEENIEEGATTNKGKLRRRRSGRKENVKLNNKRGRTEVTEEEEEETVNKVGEEEEEG